MLITLGYSAEKNVRAYLELMTSRWAPKICTTFFACRITVYYRLVIYSINYKNDFFFRNLRLLLSTSVIGTYLVTFQLMKWKVLFILV